MFVPCHLYISVQNDDNDDDNKDDGMNDIY